MPRVITVSKPSSSAYLSLIASVVSLALILLGAVGLLLVQKPLLQQSQDIRGNASVADGKVLVTSAYSGTLTNGDHSLTLNANTQGLQVERFELVFHIITQAFSEAPRVILLPNTNLQLTKTEIQQTTDGYLLSVIAAPLRTGNTFTSNGEKGLIQLQFYPTRSGSLVLDIDAEKSLAKTTGTGGNGDQLKPVAAATYTVSRSTADSSFKQCNESCTSNAQCAAGFRCFENRCRLATHPTNSSCDVPDDMGLNRQCNEYCADTRECGKGFTCFFNRCRLPNNPDNTTCAAPAATVQQNIVKSCNQACTSNAQCAVNLRCFQGACRLATNPSSSSCSAATTTIVSDTYYRSVGGPTSPTKGQPAPADRDDDEVKPTGTGTGSATRPGTRAGGATPAPTTRPATGSGTTGTATRSGAATPSGTTSPFVITSSPAPSPVSSPVVTPLPEGIVAGGSSTWPLMALAGGIGLLLLVVVLALVNIFRRRNSTPVPPKSASTQAYEADLQSKINSLRQQNGGQTTAPARPIQPAAPQTPPPSTLAPRPAAAPAPVPSRPFAPPAPVTSQPPQPVRPISAPPTTFSRPPATTQMPTRPIAAAPAPIRQAAPVPAARPIQAAPTPQAQPSSNSSMMARLKQKGVSVPGNHTP